ncbi:YciI family protein [Agromyces mariniharenae]|uniref:YciI family protein n=1 Tax=Agromyces mariniharenae TaxID=2604423 RepID=A0A5S4VBQ6_9MICO|nr:YciI family protein [Agromyces mariniharenae]TYL54090.1 YciI family protein [Agromyces mariniharenae]
MKYLIQIYSNPESRAMWDSFTPEQQAEGYAYYQAISEELVSSGEYVAAEALADASLAKRVTQTDGSAVASDGPFAETKELLAGFYLVDCETEARAVEIAARFPEAEFGLIEVRPVLDMAARGDV